MKFDTSLLKTNKRGLSTFENVCVHSDGMEAKVGVEDSMCTYGKGTLHLYVAQNNQFIRPDLVAAYVAHQFLNVGDLQTNVDLFFNEGFNVEIPQTWIVDGLEIRENNKMVECHRSDQHVSRYKDRQPRDSEGETYVSPRTIDTDGALRRLINDRIQNRVYKRDLQPLIDTIAQAISSNLGYGKPRSEYDRAISLCLTMKYIKGKIDKPTRDKTRENYRASDHIRHGTQTFTKKLTGYAGVRG